MSKSTMRNISAKVDEIANSTSQFGSSSGRAKVAPHLVRHAADGSEYRDFTDVFRACASFEMNGLPFPIYYRNCGVVQAWRYILRGLPLWQNLSHPERTFSQIHHEIDRVVMQPYLRGPRAPGWEQFHHILPLVPVQSAGLIKFHNEGGKVIEVTPTLETLLVNSDADLALPMTIVAPQFSAQYIKFGPIAAGALEVPALMPSGRSYDGAFCFLTPPLTGDTANAGIWSFELVFVVKQGGDFDGQISLTGHTDRVHGTLGEWLTGVLASAPPAFMQSATPCLEVAVSYVVKVLLYMGLPNVSHTVNAAHTAAQLQVAGLGPRKQAKLRQRMTNLYDSIIVGPAALSLNGTHFQRSGPVCAHWRRGHFRMQPCGPNKQDRKLIFISPILVHAAQYIAPVQSADRTAEAV